MTDGVDNGGGDTGRSGAGADDHHGEALTEGWNFDIEQAPKGGMVSVTRNYKGEMRTFEEYQAPRIIAAGNGGVVTVSWWIPAKQHGSRLWPARWCMFTAEVPPLAWKPWPDHPHREKTDA